MPKRRVSTAKQRAASRRNLMAARAARARQGSTPAKPVRRQQNYDKAAYDKPWVQMRTLLKPHGKNTVLYHRTTKSRAGTLVKKGFKAKKGDEGKVYFSDRKNASAKTFGDAMVSVTVPRKYIKKGNVAQQGMKVKRLMNGNTPEKHPRWRKVGQAEAWYELDSKNIAGLKVKKVSASKPKSQRSRRAKR